MTIQWIRYTPINLGSQAAIRARYPPFDVPGPSPGFGSAMCRAEPSAGRAHARRPARLRAMQVVTVTATSQSEATKFATAPVTLVPGIPEDLHLTNLTMTSGSARYQATQSITADTNVVIGGSATVTFTAGTITLDPGFHATAGGSGTTFHAVIQ